MQAVCPCDKRLPEPVFPPAKWEYLPRDRGFPSGASGKKPQNLSANAGDLRDAGSVPAGPRRSPGGGYGNPLQYSCLENPMDRGA